MVVMVSSGGEDSTKSEGDTDSGTELGGMWYSIFQDVVAMKDSRLLNLVPFGSEVPPCRAWGDADDDRTRYWASYSSNRVNMIVIAHHRHVCISGRAWSCP